MTYIYAWILGNTLVAGLLALLVAVVVRLLRPRPALAHLLWLLVGSSRVDLQACKLEYSIVSPK